MDTSRHAFVQIINKSNRQNFYRPDKGVILIMLLQFHINIKQNESKVHQYISYQISQPPQN